MGIDTKLDFKKTAVKMTVVILIANVFLTAFKFVAGLLGNSSAMISDAFHSSSDVISEIIVIIGIIIASKTEDSRHRYGHERFECVASIVLSVILFGIGIIAGYNGVKSLITGSYKEIAVPETIALIAAIVSIVIKESLFWITLSVSKKINSVSLKASAYHQRSDSLSSIGSLIGIAGALIFKLPILDVIASIVICILIVKTAIEIFIEAVDKMVDKSCSEEKETELKNIICNTEGVLRLDDLKTRMFSSKIYVDVEIGVYENLPLKSAHEIAQTVHDNIESSDPLIKHCMVHVNPVSINANINDNGHLEN